MIVTKDDFIGIFEVSIDRRNEAMLDQYITTFERQYLEDLLGCALAELFITDLDPSGIPQTPIYQNLYNPFCIDDDCHIHRSFGIKDMLTGFIYWEWMREQKFKKTVNGTVVGDSENSNETRFSQFGLYQVYNRSIKSYKAIQWYICENLTVYPDYNGSKKEVTSWI